MEPLSLAVAFGALIWYLSRGSAVSTTKRGAILPAFAPPAFTANLPWFARPQANTAPGNAAGTSVPNRSRNGLGVPSTSPAARTLNQLAQPGCAANGPAPSPAKVCGCGAGAAGTGADKPRCKTRPTNNYTDGAGACLQSSQARQIASADDCGSGVADAIKRQAAALEVLRTQDPAFEALFGNALAAGLSDENAKRYAGCVMEKAAGEKSQAAARAKSETALASLPPFVTYSSAPPAPPARDTRPRLNATDTAAMMAWDYGNEAAEIMGISHLWNPATMRTEEVRGSGVNPADAYANAVRFGAGFRFDQLAPSGMFQTALTGAIPDAVLAAGTDAVNAYTAFFNGR